MTISPDVGWPQPSLLESSVSFSSSFTLFALAQAAVTAARSPSQSSSWTLNWASPPTLKPWITNSLHGDRDLERPFVSGGPNLFPHSSQNFAPERDGNSTQTG